VRAEFKRVKEQLESEATPKAATTKKVKKK
jgi:hypothetical protein